MARKTLEESIIELWKSSGLVVEEITIRPVGKKFVWEILAHDRTS